MVEIKNEHVTRVLRGVLQLGRRLRAERPEGSTGLSSLGVLSTLDRLGPMPATRLATYERLQPQSLTRIMSALEERGWIVRKRSPEDRRELIIALTKEGRRALMDDMLARGIWLEEVMAAQLTQEDRDLLLKASDLMVRLAGAPERG